MVLGLPPAFAGVDPTYVSSMRIAAQSSPGLVVATASQMPASLHRRKR